MTRFTRPVTASPADIDELGHVNNAVWVRWIQELATAHWDAVAPPEHRAAYIWVVTRHEIDYRGNVIAGETVTGETWVSEAPKGARFDRHVRFTGTDGRVKVEAVTTWALLDRATGRLLRVRPEVAAPFLKNPPPEGGWQAQPDGGGGPRVHRSRPAPSSFAGPPPRSGEK